uniref:Asl1-like glycosyl hydrolase catalytic domain-containing protein n=1 Tax=Kwoniella bestiolae CBS 10118 TaxID=1296100 RepID=A0A1B9FY12_9TREE|nr:hypothetical protein I302_06623 [Kwoniella bestiolae CBS 10118]OCF23640.1 hypothetical protein I302_06623 [Kwoniella bestiolae CBS 10118]
MLPLIALLILALPPTQGLNDNLTGPGLAWPNQLWVPTGGFTAPGTTLSSYYTWGPDPIIPPANSSGIWDIPFPFIPMLWGCTQSYIEPFQRALWSNFSNATLTPRREILGFNEPDHPQQAACTPQEAARVWREVLEPLRYQGYRVGSPAVTSGEAGRKWMRDWYEACMGGCKPDFLALHWYDLVPQNFIEHIQYYHNTYNLPIWVTEYASQNFSVFNPSTGQYDNQATYVEQGVNELDCLFDPSGKPNRTGALNELGVQYAGSNGSVSVGQQLSSGGRRRIADWSRFRWIDSLGSLLS